MRITAVGLIALSCLMAACSQSGNIPAVQSPVAALPTAGADAPAVNDTLFEAEQSDLAQTDAADVALQTVVDPAALRNAQVVSDPAASGGQTVKLSPNSSRVTFTVPASFKGGTYNLSLRSRAQTLDGSPTLTLRRSGSDLGHVKVTSTTYQGFALGSVKVQPGDRLSVVYTNDGSGSAAASARNTMVDYLNIDTGTAPVVTPPVVTPPVVTPPVVTPPVVTPPVVTPPVVTPPVVTPPVVTPPVVTPPVVGGIKLPPSGKVAWDWQIGAGGDSGITVPAGVTLLDVDGFDTSAAKVAQLKAQDIYTVCYLDVGSFEPGRPDSDQYPAYLKIQQDPDWPAEYFLDVTDVFKPNSALATILKNRFAMCKSKGFDALEPDNLQNDENVSGGKITVQQQIDFNGWVADAAHAAGLAVFQKNGPDKILLSDRTGKMMVDKFDGILNEQCQEYGECAALAEYSKRGKLALDTEYKSGLTLNCTSFVSLNVNAIKKNLNLTAGTRTACN